MPAWQITLLAAAAALLAAVVAVTIHRVRAAWRRRRGRRLNGRPR